jgi:vitamin B12 transporter
MKLLSLAGLMLALALAVIPAFAADSGSIRGTITDPLGAVVPNATVKLIQNAKQVTSTNTDQTGKYSFSSVAPGRYQIAAEAPTFASQTSSPVYVGSGGTAEVNLALKVGTVSQQLIVTSTGTQLPESQVGASVTVISSNDFQDKLDILEPLRLVPGAQVVQTSQRGGVGSVFIRGGNSNANKVLIDGVAVNDIGGLVNFGTLATTGIDHLEVLRGPNSVLYGSDAMAGVVSLTTRRGSTPLPELTYAFDAGNFNSLRHEASLGGAFRRLDYYGAFSRFDTGNSVPNSTFHNATSVANLGWAATSTTDIRFTGWHTNTAVGEPGALDFFGIPNDSFRKEENTFVSATVQNQTTSRWHNLFRYGATRLRVLDENPTPTGIFDPLFGNFLGNTVTIKGANGFSTTGQGILDFGGTYPSILNTLGNRDTVEIQSDYSLNSHLLGLFGFRYEDERGFTLFGSSKTPAKRQNFGYTGEIQGNLFGRLYATLGMGFEDNAVFGTATTPRVSLAYHLFRPRTDRFWSGTKLKFNYGQGIKEASIGDQSFSLFNLLSTVPGGAQTIAQFHIKPVSAERLRSFGRAKLGVTFFHNQFKDQIEFVDPSALPKFGVPSLVAPFGATLNTANTRALGAETEIDLTLGHGFRARADYTYLDAVVLHSFTSDAVFPSINPAIPNVPIGLFAPLTGARPFRRAPHTASFLLGYSRPKLALSLSGYLVSRRDDSTFITDGFFGPGMALPNRNLAKAYQKIDFGGTYRINRYLALYSSIENLASQHYDAAFGFPNLPFTFRSGMRITLGGESWK